MGRVCSTYWRQKRSVKGFRGNLRERENLEDTGVEGRILKFIFKKWIDLAQDRNVNALMNLRFPPNPRNFLTS
jgi:hypothetical protein